MAKKMKEWRDIYYLQQRRRAGKLLPVLSLII
jgi:hypothetical protein